jgi:hypothetical protein
MRASLEIDEVRIGIEKRPDNIDQNNFHNYKNTRKVVHIIFPSLMKFQLIYIN